MKQETGVLIAIILSILAIIMSIDRFESDTIDQVCSNENSILRRIDDKWICSEEYNQIYGEMWGRNILNTSILQTNTYYNVTGLTQGEVSGVNYSNSRLIIKSGGVYKITSQFSFKDGANTEFHLAMGKNGLRDEHCHTARKIGTGGDVGSASFTCIDRFNLNDIITVMVENIDNTNDPEIESINMNLIKISN